jgi:hypothetical protein
MSAPRIINQAHFGAYMKGYRDPTGTNPYNDKRKWNGGLTWSRSYQTAFDEGQRDAREGLPVRYSKRVTGRGAR